MMSWSDDGARLVLAWLFTYALHSTVLLGLTALIARRVRSERGGEILWKSALVGGVLTASLQVGANINPLGGRFVLPGSDNSEPALVAIQPAQQSGFEQEQHAQYAPSASVLDFEFDTAVVDQPSDEPSGVAALVPESALKQDLLRTSGGSGWSATFAWSEWVLFAWIALGALFLSLFVLALARLSARLGGRRRVTEGRMPALLALLRRRAGILRPVRLTVSERIEAPIALGTLWPQICVPPRALTELEPELQETLLAHELAHIARFDPLWLSLARVLETVFFFQPLNRRARREMQHKAEFLCDAWAVEHTQNRLGLARCLAEVARWIVSERRPLPACGMANLQSPLGQRIERILDEEPERRPRSRSICTALATFSLVGVCFVPGFAAVPDRAHDEPIDASFHDEHPPLLESAPAPVASTVLTTTARSAPALGALFQSFDQQLQTLDSELASIRALAAGRELPTNVMARIATIEHRVRGVRARQHRIQMLLSQLNQHNSKRASQQGETTEKWESR